MIDHLRRFLWRRRVAKILAQRGWAQPRSQAIALSAGGEADYYADGYSPLDAIEEAFRQD